MIFTTDTNSQRQRGISAAESIMKFRQHAIILTCVLALAVLAPTSTLAGIIVAIDDVSLTTGGPSGFVDVNVSWSPDVAEPATVNIDYFFANMTITAIGLPSSIVSFRTYDPFGSRDNGDHQLTDPNYLFAGNSINVDQSQHAGTVGGVNDTVFNGSDARFDFDPLNSPGNWITLTDIPKLLFRLELLATGVATGTETFALSMDATPDSQFIDNDSAEISFVAGSGRITVTNGATTAAVPEPSTGILFLLGAGFLTGCRRRLQIESLV